MYGPLIKGVVELVATLIERNKACTANASCLSYLPAGDINSIDTEPIESFSQEEKALGSNLSCLRFQVVPTSKSVAWLVKDVKNLRYGRKALGCPLSFERTADGRL